MSNSQATFQARQMVTANIDQIMACSIAHVRRTGREVRIGQTLNLKLRALPEGPKLRFARRVTAAQFEAAASLA